MRRQISSRSPSITLLAVLTVAAGFALAAPASLDAWTFATWRLLIHALIGSALVAGGTNALNQVLVWGWTAAGGTSTFRQAVLTAVALVPTARSRTPHHVRRLFLFTLAYLPAILTFMIADRVA